MAHASTAAGLVVSLDAKKYYVSRGWTVEAFFNDNLSALILPPARAPALLSNKEEVAQ